MILVGENMKLTERERWLMYEAAWWAAECRQQSEYFQVIEQFAMWFREKEEELYRIAPPAPEPELGPVNCIEDEL